MNLTKHEETKKGSLFHENEKLRILYLRVPLIICTKLFFLSSLMGFMGFIGLMGLMGLMGLWAG